MAFSALFILSGENDSADRFFIASVAAFGIAVKEHERFLQDKP